MAKNPTTNNNGAVATKSRKKGYPHSVTLTLLCDGDKDRCDGFGEFTSPDGFIACHDAAIKRGWLERQSPQGPRWLCPRCAKKIQK
jgi:hypothetical protein